MPGSLGLFVIKRCTLVVQDVRRSIAFYRDVLGLAQSADVCTTIDGKIVPAGLPGAHVHLAVMDVGAIELGLLQWTDPPLAKPDDPYPIHLGVGDCAFVLETADFAATHVRLKHAHEARISVETDGVGFFDPDGQFFELHPASDRAQPQLVRATLIVRDIAASLAFYRDVLGLEVISDRTVQSSNPLLPSGAPGARMRLATLGTADAAVVCLQCFLDPPLDEPGRVRHHLGIGDAFFVAQADDLTALHARLKDSGARLHAAPTRLRADDPTQATMAMSFFDPDARFFEVTSRQPA